MRIETERLILRPWEERDRAPLAAILGDPEVRRYYPSTLTPEATSKAIDTCIASTAEHGFGFGAAELRETGQLVGLIGLSTISETTRAAIRGGPGVEVGWQFDKAMWGRGLAPEGAGALVRHGLDVLGLPEIIAFTFKGNLPSQRVMEKIGMTHDPADDFEHPALAPDHPLRSHVVYRIRR